MAELGLQEAVKMSSNENPFGCSARAKAALPELAEELHVYRRLNQALRARLARSWT